MTMEINDMLVEIKKTWYNKTHVQEDGVTHIVDTEHSYPVFQFGMAKNYFDIDDKNVLIDSLVGDLRNVIAELEKQKDKEKDQERE